MKKSMYTAWYDKSVHDHIEAIADKYDNAIPIFGGALWVHDKGFDAIVDYLPKVVENARFFGWHAGIADAIRTYLHICNIDPMLVEAYLGVRFSQLYP
jgi:hypothetical protein